MDKHDLIQDLIRIASDLGRTPTKREYIQLGKFSHRFETPFGTYTQFVQAAGLDAAVPVRSRKITNDVFKVDIQKHLEEYKPRNVQRKKIYYPTLATISDIHWPFSCQRVIDKFYEYVAAELPEYVILNGDAWDMYSHSKFARSHNIFTPREEQRLAREANEKFWLEIKRIHPNSKCYQLMGNHDLRPLKRVLESYPEAEDWVKEKIQSLFTFPGVTTLHDHREELQPDEDTLVFHGYRGKLGDHRDFTLTNVHVGHTHHGGVVYRMIRGGHIYECNSGFAGDPEAKGLTYTPQKTTTQTPGFSVRDKWGARFIPA